MFPRAVGFVAVLVIGSAAHAAPPANVLSGPTVVESGASASLARYDYGGALHRLDRQPELEALDRLMLDDETARGVNAVLEARARLLDRPDHRKIPVLLEIQAAQANQELDRLDAALARLAAMNPLLTNRGSLRDDLCLALDDGSRARFLALVDEYREAWIADEAAALGDAAAAEAAYARQARLDELSASYARTLGRRQAEFNELLGALSLSPEQDAEIRGAVVRVIESAASDGKPRGRTVLGALGDILWTLDWSQRAELLRQVRARSGRPESRPLRDYPQVALGAMVFPIIGFWSPRRKRKPAARA